MSRKIKETKCTCMSCGNVYHYGKAEALENAGNSMQNCGKSMMCCTGCVPAVLIGNKPVKDLKKCPKCGSRAVKKEVVTHTI